MGKTQQRVARSYPFGSGYNGSNSELWSYLNEGYRVVMANPIVDCDGAQGVEYIVEKEIES